MWCGQNWLAGSQSGVRKSIGGGLIKFSPNGTSLSPAITGFTGWEWTASGGVRPWHSTKSGSGHPEIAHGVQSDSASADPDLKGFHLGRIVGGKTQDRIRLGKIPAGVSIMPSGSMTKSRNFARSRYVAVCTGNQTA